MAEHSVEALVDFVVISGLDENQDLTNEIYADSGADDNRPLEQSYQPHVLHHYPNERPWESAFDPNSVALMCFPRGLRFKLPSDYRRVSLHPFTITKEGGDRTYGVSLKVYEEITNHRTIEALNMLEQMYMHSHESLLSTFTTTSSRRENVDSRASIGGGFKPITRLYAPKSIALLSQFPVVATLEQFLRQLYAVERSQSSSCSTEKLLRNLLCSVPVPVDGWSVTFSCIDQISLHRPSLQELPLCQFSFRRLFGIFTVETVVKLFTCILLEQQIVLVSSDYELPMLVSECLTTLMYPFLWQNVYVPILPSNALHFLEAPVPFIMGIHSSMGNLEFGNVDCLVDMDNGDKTLPEDLPELPYKQILIKSLKELLRSPEMSKPPSTDCESWRVPPYDNVDLPPGPNNIDSEEERQYNQKIREIFLATFVRMFANIDSYIITPEENYKDDCDPDGQEIFDKLSFFSDQPKEHLEFLLRFTQSQIFAGFMDAQGFGRGQAIGDHSLAFFKRMIGRVSGEAAVIGNGDLEECDKLQHIFRRASDGNIGDSVALQSEHTFVVSLKDCERENMRDKQGLFAGLDDLKLCDVQLDEYHEKIRGVDTAAMEALVASALDLSENPDGVKQTSTLRNGPVNSSAMSAPSGSSEGRQQSGIIKRSMTDGGSSLTRRHTDSQPSSRGNSSRRRGDVSRLQSDARGSSDMRQRTGSSASRGPPRATSAQAQVLMTFGQITASASHDSYHQTLLQECSSKIKTCVLAGLDGETATSLGYAGAAGIDHIVFAFCEALERVWRHGCRSTGGKSCLWVFLDQSSKILSASGCNIDQNTVATIENMNLMTDVGRARAWVRLCLERKTLKEELEVFLSTPNVMKRFFKSYAFLMQEEYRTQFLFQLLSLTTVELMSFSPKYPEAVIEYDVTIFTAKGIRGASSQCVNFSCTGTFLTSDPILCPSGSHFGSGQECNFKLKNKNLGVLTNCSLRHGGTAWTVEGILIKNLLTLVEVWFEPDPEVTASVSGNEMQIVLLPQTETARDAFEENSPTKRTSGERNGPISKEVQKAHDALCESVASMVNCIIRSYEAEPPAPSPPKRALLLVGGSRMNTRTVVELNADGVDSITDGGLCKTLLYIFNYGFKSSSFLGTDRHPWDLLAKFTTAARKAEVSDRPPAPRKSRRSSSSFINLETYAGRASRDSFSGPMSQARDPALASDPVNLLVTTIERANRAKISKAVRFEFLVCAGASYHVLHVWFKALADFAVTSGLYNSTSVFHNDAAIAEVTELMRMLIDKHFDLLGRLLYVRYDEGSFWELQDEINSPIESPQFEE